jgi:NADP-dependent 3-hydroxy acid dehydrogenase YdfG
MSSLQAESLFTVAGKVVLITGGSRGIGKMVSAAPPRKAQLLMFPDCLRIR